MDQWYKDREGKTQLNFGTASSHEFARSLVLDGAMGKDSGDALKTRAVGNNWSQKKVTGVSEPQCLKGEDIMT